MSIEIEAVYENGALKLDRPLPLQEHQRVKVVVHEEPSLSSQIGQDDDWWDALQHILVRQQQRGFVGTVTDDDRSDEGYDERMREILANTTPDRAVDRKC